MVSRKWMTAIVGLAGAFVAVAGSLYIRGKARDSEIRTFVQHERLALTERPAPIKFAAFKIEFRRTSSVSLAVTSKSFEKWPTSPMELGISTPIGVVVAFTIAGPR